MSTAEELKAEGNKKYADKEYIQAIALYAKAIELAPENASLYGNRAAAYLMVRDYKSALNDSLNAIKRDPQFVRGYQRAAKSLQHLGRFGEAEQNFKKWAELDPQNAQPKSELHALQHLATRAERAEQFVKDGMWDEAIHLYLNLFSECELFAKGKVLYATALIRAKRHTKAMDIIREVMQDDPSNEDVQVIRAEALMYMGNPDNALKILQHILAMDPDNNKAKVLFKKIKGIERAKESGNTHFKAGRYAEAVEAYSDGIEQGDGIDSFTSVLLGNRAAAYMSLNQYEQAEADCSMSIDIDSSNVKTILRRARCFMKLEKYEEAVRDFENANKLDPGNRETRAALQDAKLELKKSKRKDFYKILGVSKECTEYELKKAYRKLALTHHPDKCQGTEEEKIVAEARFKEISEAYSILSDPQKRRRFDSGADLDDDFGGMGGGGVDPSDLFNMFFQRGGGGGARGFPFGGGGFGGGFGGGGYDDDDGDAPQFHQHGRGHHFHFG